VCTTQQNLRTAIVARMVLADKLPSLQNCQVRAYPYRRFLSFY
jgi:hypothetical protein